MKNPRRSLTLAKNLTSECKSRGITLTKLARLSGVKQPTLHGWSTGRGVKKMEDLALVCDVLEISLYEMLFGTPDPFNKPQEIINEVSLGEVQVIIKRITKRENP